MDKKTVNGFKKKHIIGLIIFISLIILCSGLWINRSSVNNVADSNITLKFHYSRNDDTYDRWKLWVWEDTGAGRDYSFTEADETGAHSYVTVDNKTAAVGYIIHMEEWEKDVAVDRSVDLSEITGGTVDVYLTQGEEEAEIRRGEDVIQGIKVIEAVYNSENGIEIKAFDDIDSFNGVKVYCTTGDEVAVQSVLTKGNQCTIHVEEPLMPIKSYSLVYKGASYVIDMPNIYSTEEFESEYTYAGNDLGANWTKEKTVFKVWAPTADSIKVCLYENGTSGVEDKLEELEMIKGSDGVWAAEKQGDQNGVYYTFKVKVNHKEVEACDPYAHATGINGDRAMVIDLASTNPRGWETDVNPNKGADLTDAIIYELGVRDFSIDSSSGISEQNRGKYLAFTEEGTKNAEGEITGIDYLKSLGVTHIQIMPIQDFGFVDEQNPSYNWGYATKNYNVPEGSYASNPYDGEVRIRETKEMIQALHENGMSVVMDVVYNHVYDASEFCFNQIVPDYFTRINSRGEYSNGSLCGNDTASERSMVRKYIVDSVIYWIEEYHVDGFRFDLAGILDVETVNEIVRRVREIDPSIILYGEGWNMSTISTKPGTKFAIQTSAAQTEGFGYFDDRIRSGIKGKSNDNSAGYITGADNAEQIKRSVKADAGWCDNPQQIINYVSCHDDATLWDKVRICAAGTYEEQIRQNKLASAIILSSQGISFIHAGDELLRTKVDESGKVIYNSFESSDYVNSIKWNSLSEEEIKDLKEYYQGLILFRKEHKALRMNTRDEIAENIEYIDNLPQHVVAYMINGENIEEEVSDWILIVFNPNHYSVEMLLPEGVWNICVNGEKAGLDVIESINGTITLDAISAYMLIQ